MAHVKVQTYVMATRYARGVMALLNADVHRSSTRIAGMHKQSSDSKSTCMSRFKFIWQPERINSCFVQTFLQSRNIRAT